jgi:hypothetical protein
MVKRKKSVSIINNDIIYRPKLDDETKPKEVKPTKKIYSNLMYPIYYMYIPVYPLYPYQVYQQYPQYLLYQSYHPIVYY